MNNELQSVAAGVLDDLGFELVELARGGSRSRPTLQVRIDRRDGQRVSVDDCARASRALESRLEADQLVNERYVLEVSSPGADRALRSAAEWRRFVGRRAKVLSNAIGDGGGGREEVDILGVEGTDGEEIVVLRTPRGEELKIPLAEVHEARLAFHW